MFACGGVAKGSKVRWVGGPTNLCVLVENRLILCIIVRSMLTGIAMLLLYLLLSVDPSPPPAHPSLLPPRFHPHSSPDDSDVETPERNAAFSPEMVEIADNEERKADARKRRE